MSSPKNVGKHNMFREKIFENKPTGAARTIDLINDWILRSPKQSEKMEKSGCLKGRFGLTGDPATMKHDIIERIKSSPMLKNLKIEFQAEESEGKTIMVATLTPWVQVNYFKVSGLPMPPGMKPIPDDAVEPETDYPDIEVPKGAALKPSDDANVTSCGSQSTVIGSSFLSSVSSIRQHDLARLGLQNDQPAAAPPGAQAGNGDSAGGCGPAGEPSRKRHRPLESAADVKAAGEKLKLHKSESELAPILRALYDFKMDKATLKETLIGKKMNTMRGHENEKIKKIANHMYSSWLAVYRGENTKSKESGKARDNKPSTEKDRAEGSTVDVSS